jgi:hypothetical protein
MPGHSDHLDSGHRPRAPGSPRDCAEVLIIGRGGGAAGSALLNLLTTMDKTNLTTGVG